MKLITAIIRERKLDQVREALIEADIQRITISRVSGHGQPGDREEIHRGRRVIPSVIPKMRLEIAVNDEFVDLTVNAILKGAKTANPLEPEIVGRSGDGKIFITELQECIRIRTEEKGGGAI